MPLTIYVEGGELYNEKTNEFVACKPQVLRLEHSLVSLSKWEQKWHKPFLVKTEKTNEEVLDYIRCMTLDSNIDASIYSFLSKENYEQIDAYIQDPMTATTIGNDPNEKKNNKIVTNEVIYYWMCELNIPPEYAKWHLNRLLTLIQVASIEKAPPKKMSKREALNRTQSINAARRAKLKAEREGLS